MYDLDAVMSGYVECALWSSTDDNEEPMDANYDRSDISPDSLDTMRQEVSDFLALLERDRPGVTDVMMATRTWSDPGRVGHDLWLTRNHHGAGFWDRGEGELGDFLTKWSKTYGGSDLYVGDDGLVHVQ